MAWLTKNARGRTGGRFTLIELLVIVAIIAILAAMLSPSLRNALESAKALRCGNNFRILGMAFLQFADDNQGRLPAYGQYIEGNGSLCWHNVLNKTTLKQAGLSVHWTGPITNAGTNVLYCPNATYITGYDRHIGMNDNVAGGAYDKMQVTDTSRWPGRPFGGREAEARYFLGTRVASARHPSRLVVATDTFAGGGDTFYYSGNNDPEDKWLLTPTDVPGVNKLSGVSNPNLTFRHGNGVKMPLLYLGGNVAQVTPKAGNFRRENFLPRP